MSELILNHAAGIDVDVECNRKHTTVGAGDADGHRRLPKNRVEGRDGGRVAACCALGHRAAANVRGSLRDDVGGAASDTPGSRQREIVMPVDDGNTPRVASRWTDVGPRR